MLKIVPLSRHLGADISGLNLRKVTKKGEPEQVDELRRIVSEYKVLRFREQHLEPGELVGLASIFGPVRSLKRADLSTVHIPKHPEIKVVSNVSKNGKMVGDGGSSENAWHTDGSYLVTPTAMTLLYGRKAPTRQPPRTFFLSLQTLYDRLPKEFVNLIRPLRAIHYSPWAYAPEYAAEIEALPEGADRRHIGPSHPLIRRDPATGRLSLFPPRQRACVIENHSSEESKNISDALWDLIETTDEFWGDTIQPDDLMLFDNRFTMHRREPFNVTEERILWHVTTDGERPE